MFGLSILLTFLCLVMAAILCPWLWLAVIAVVVLLVASRKGQSLDAYGTARWAEIGDVEDMLSVKGLILGAMEDTTGRLAALKGVFGTGRDRLAVERFLNFGRGGHYRLLSLNKAVHTAAFIPTGGGKGVSLVIPMLLSCPESMIVLDYKGENARITSRARRKLGQKVAFLDPFKDVTQTPDTLNPLDFIDPNSPTVIDECRALAAALVVRTGEEREPHWNDAAELWIAAMIAVVVTFAEAKHRNLQAVRDLLTDRHKMEAAIQLMCSSTAFGGMLARIGHQLTHYVDRELGSVLTTANRHLNFLDTPTIAASTEKSSFDPAGLIDGKMTIYLIVPPEHISQNRALLRMWIVTLLRAVIRRGLQEKNKVHVILDEAATLGHMDIIDDAVDKFRGYGIRLLFLFQSIGQLKESFPQGQEQTLLSNVTQIFAGVNDPDTAKYVSTRLGKSTEIVTSGGTSTTDQTSAQGGGQGGRSSSYSRSTSRSENWQQVGRELLMVDEVMNLDKRIAICFTPGKPPIWVTMVRYFEPGFTTKTPWLWPVTKALFLALLSLVLMAGVTCILANEVDKKLRDPGPGFFMPDHWEPQEPAMPAPGNPS
jgi:type IV secretion system protein VirD4